MSKLKMWDDYSSWEEAETSWDKGASEASTQLPLKSLKSLPQMVGITRETKKHLRWKSLKWMISQDKNRVILKEFFRHPFLYFYRYVKSLIKSESFTRDADFFYYGIKDKDDFRALAEKPNALFVLGFSYCHKPFECPSGRFTDSCLHDPSNPVCRQCFIGKAFHALPEKNSVPVCIPTIHCIAEKIIALRQLHPDKELIFLITACEMTLTMFGDWGNMAGIKGIGVRLDGRICNTMDAFVLSERGVKPGLTVVLPESQRTILDLIQHWRFSVKNSGATDGKVDAGFDRE